MDKLDLRQGGGAALLSDAASPAHLRIDLWNRVREGVEELARKPSDDRRSELENLFRRLDEVERLWAYPGAERIEQVRRHYRAGDVTQLREVVNDLADRLSQSGDRAALADGAKGARYFTLLLVGTMAPEQLRALRRNLYDLRATRPGDLVYEIVQVASFEEAWLAVMCNVDIQAVVMRQSFPIGAAECRSNSFGGCSIMTFSGSR